MGCLGVKKLWYFSHFNEHHHVTLKHVKRVVTSSRPLLVHSKEETIGLRGGEWGKYHHDMCSKLKEHMSSFNGHKIINLIMKKIFKNGMAIE